jgi:hypothetical protein
MDTTHHMTREEADAMRVARGWSMLQLGEACGRSEEWAKQSLRPTRRKCPSPWNDARRAAIAAGLAKLLLDDAPSSRRAGKIRYFARMAGVVS